ncbi:MAG: HNH endonuclease [Gammaproteobacteria bacterium]|nr:MAG: HNH endonuclease [Gammaproteobacteria bacterium]
MRKKVQEVTQQELKALLTYDQETGLFVWKEQRGGQGGGKTKAGDIAGYKTPKGYIVIKINYKLYMAHILAFLYMEGYYSEFQIDHEDRVKHHNWWNNLREATSQCQSRNIGNQINSKSGVKGVSPVKSGKWYASIMVDGKTRNLGYHESIMEAACHRLAGEQCVDWAGCDSNSPAYKYVILGKRRTLNTAERRG